MWHTIITSITHHHHLLLVMVLLFFMLSETTTATHFNKSLEAKALLATNWWPQYANASDEHCNWAGIYCNDAGSVTDIYFYNDNLESDLGRLDLSSFPNLVRLGLDDCGLEGSIPEQIGLLSNLTYLSLWSNRLTETTTATHFNKSLEAKALLSWWPYANASDDHCNWEGIGCNKAGSVIEIGLYCYYPGGRLDLGSLDFSSFPNLELFTIDYCDLEGSITEQIGLLSNLTLLSLQRNRLTGNLPVSLGNLTSLKTLYLSGNNFSGQLPVSLGNLIRLEDLSLCRNNFSGQLPTSLTNLTSLKTLYLYKNQLTGPILPSYGSMLNLTYLDFNTNQLNASIPEEISKLQNLQILDLGDNNFTGPIPLNLGNLSQLYILNLGMNSISGPIPLGIVNLVNLQQLDLNQNSLVGPIHGNLSRLSYLDVSSNRMLGNLSFQNPCILQHLDLSVNRMTGAFTSLLGCKHLEYLDVSCNKFVGEELDDLKFPYLKFIDQSLNHNLTAIIPIPSSVQDNKPDLSCNAFSGQSTCKEHMPIDKRVHHLTIFLPIILGLSCVLLLVYMCYKNHNATENKIQLETKKHGNVCSMLNYDGTIAYEDFISATEDFDLKYCIGTGGYGSVYEAKLPDGKIFALKKLHRFEAEQFNQSFKNEVQVLTNLRHKNIVKLYGFCLHNKCNFLVYEYMEKGSLFCALSNSELVVEVDWMKRVNIIKGVAHALAYMHHDCSPTIVHRDISTNNILLNVEMEGFVGDFGAARLLDPDSSN